MLEDLDGEYLRACRSTFGAWIGRKAKAQTMLLRRRDVAQLMTLDDWLASAETAFLALAQSRAEVPLPLAVEGDGGTFHAKGASIVLDRRYVALKLNANFPGNALRELPTIQGAILLCDGETGRLLAIMDSIELTLRRTAAATALAAKYLARPDAHTVLVCGCGAQAHAQLDALRAILPLRQGFCWDQDPSRARKFARTSGLAEARDLTSAAQASNVIVTCTTATEPFLTAEMVRPGTFVSAVGADSPHKSEVAPDLFASALVVADSLARCAVMGDLHHALASAATRVEEVHAELAELVSGAKPGRTDDREVTLFDSTGVAVQDVAAAAAIFDRAIRRRSCRTIDLAA